MSHTFRRMQYGALCARVHSRRYLGRVTTLDKTHTDVIHQVNLPCFQLKIVDFLSCSSDLDPTFSVGQCPDKKTVKLESACQSSANNHACQVVPRRKPTLCGRSTPVSCSRCHCRFWRKMFIWTVCAGDADNILHCEILVLQIQCGQVVKKPYQEYIVPSSSGVMVRHRRFTVPAQSNCNRAIHTHLAPLSLTPYCQGITAIAAPENYRAKTETSKTPEDNNSKSPEEEVITGARVLKSFEDNDVIVKKREMHNVPWESLKNKSGEELDQLLDRWDSRQIVKKVARKEIQHTNTLSPYEHQIETLLELLGLHNKPPKFSAVLKNDYPKETSTSFQPVFWSESAESGFHQAVAKSSVHHNNLPVQTFFLILCAEFLL